MLLRAFDALDEATIGGRAAVDDLRTAEVLPARAGLRPTLRALFEDFSSTVAAEVTAAEVNAAFEPTTFVGAPRYETDAAEYE